MNKIKQIAKAHKCFYLNDQIKFIFIFIYKSVYLYRGLIEIIIKSS